MWWHVLKSRVYKSRGESFAFRAASGVVMRRIAHSHFISSPNTHQLRRPAASEEYPIYWEVGGSLCGKNQSIRHYQHTRSTHQPDGLRAQPIRKAARSGPETILTSDRNLLGHALAQRKGQRENKSNLRRGSLPRMYVLCSVLCTMSLHHGSRVRRDIPLM